MHEYGGNGSGLPQRPFKGTGGSGRNIGYMLLARDW